MIARFHYDRDQLQSFLEDTSSSDADEIQSHVETCSQCQTELETLAQADFDWDQASHLLGNPPETRVTESRLGDATKNASHTDTSFLAPTDHPGSLGRFARYEVMEILGRGGMGIVMRGYDTSLNRYSAVKVLAPHLATSAAARKRFSREAKSAAAVVHPHVVPIQTVDEHDGMPYLVMPVVEGQSLHHRVEQSGPLSVIQTVRIAGQVAEGLAAAHDQGLVHRDIKPANVLLENGVERVQITDFGLARAVDDASMTHSGVIAGTPQYMSPEQAHGDSIDHRSDLFSLGSLIYFMLTGRSPFRAETTMGVLTRIVNDQPRSLRSINAEVPQWLEQIVERLLSKSPQERYQNASEIAAELKDWSAHLQQPDIVSAPTKQMVDSPAKGSQVRLAAGNDGRNGMKTTLRWLLGGAAFGFLLLAIALIRLETNQGTLRIECNAENPVPIVIRQDGKIVKEMTISRAGNQARLRAGEYIIEAKSDDTAIELLGEQVTIVAGDEWVARIVMEDGSSENDASENHASDNQQRRDPSTVYQTAVKDVTYGRNEAALEKFIWCWENGAKVRPAWSAVRRSFLLSTWLNLADNYPPALTKLRSIRSEIKERLLSENQLRVRSEDFADLTSIDKYLRQESLSLEVFEALDPRDQQRVQFYLPYCPAIKKPETHNCKECHQPYPTIHSDIDQSPNEPPKLSAFTRMEFDEDKVIVTYKDKQYELLAIDDVSSERLLEHAKEQHGAKWKKRLSEDMVEVLHQMNHFPGAAVDLRLQTPDSDEVLTIKDAELTRENRSQLYRSNSHNQPKDYVFPASWGGGPLGYLVHHDFEVKHSGDASVSIERTSDASRHRFGTVVQGFMAKEFAGRRLRYSGYLKTKDVESAGLWLRIDSAERGTVGFDNMSTRRLEGTHDWQEVEIVLDVPEDASMITYGALLHGTGKVWIDELSLTEVDQSVETTRPTFKPSMKKVLVPPDLRESPANLGFEEKR